MGYLLALLALSSMSLLRANVIHQGDVLVGREKMNLTLTVAGRVLIVEIERPTRRTTYELGEEIPAVNDLSEAITLIASYRCAGGSGSSNCSESFGGWKQEDRVYLRQSKGTKFLRE